MKSDIQPFLPGMQTNTVQAKGSYHKIKQFTEFAKLSIAHEANLHDVVHTHSQLYY